MSNDKNKLAKEDIETLLNFDLISFLSSQSASKDKIDQFIEKFNSLVAMLFLETDLKKAPEDVRNEIEGLMEVGNSDEVLKLMESKFPDLKLRYINNVLAAKKLVIINTLTYQITLLKADENVNDTDNSENTVKLSDLLKLAEKDKWRDFINLLNQK